MVTPLQIQEKEFQRVVRGYKETEVDEFLDEIISSMDMLIRENNNLKSKCEKLSRQNEKLNSTNDSVAETLNAAKQLMRQISNTAEKRASLLIRNAEEEAKQIRINAEHSVIKLKNESDRLRENINKFKSSYRELLEKELKKVGNDIPDDTMDPRKIQNRDISEEKLFDGIDFVADELNITDDSTEVFTEKDLINDSNMTSNMDIRSDDDNDQDSLQGVSYGLSEKDYQDASELEFIANNSRTDPIDQSVTTKKNVLINIKKEENDSPDKELEELEMMNRQTKMFRNK